MESIAKPLIFIGSGRSGTTIISEIVFRHESLAWPSNYQQNFPSFAPISLLRGFFENKLWNLQGQKPQLNKVSRVNKLLFKPAEAYGFWEYLTGPDIDFSRGFLLDKKATEKEAQKIRSAFSKLVSYQSKKRLAFKITGPSRIGYLTSIFPDAIFANIVRDPLPTINSWLNVDFWQDKGKTQLWWTGAYTKREEEWAAKNTDKPELLAAMQYKKLMDTTAAEIKQYQVPCLEVRYENFVQDPTAVINQILDFSGLEKSKNVDAYLSATKIYNQNKKVEQQTEKEKTSDLDLILKGEYAF
ncbi:MAG: sulfotransferase [Panacibacter sp.]